MTLATATIAFDVSDQVGQDFDHLDVQSWVTTNVETIHDTAGNATRVATGDFGVSDDGTGTVTVWAPSPGSNPASWQTTLHFDVPDNHARTGRKHLTYGPFTIGLRVTDYALTANVATLTLSSAPHGLSVGAVVTVDDIGFGFNGTYTLSAVTDTTVSYAKVAAGVPSTPTTTGRLTSATMTMQLTSMVEEQAVPPEYLTTVTALLDTYVDAAEGSAILAGQHATQAGVYADEAEAWADQAETIVNANVETAVEQEIIDQRLIARPADELFAVTDTSVDRARVDISRRYSEDTTLPDGTKPDTILDRWKERIGLARRPSRRIVVAAAGTEDAVTVAAALTLAAGSSLRKPYEIVLTDALYEEYSLAPTEGVEFISTCPGGSEIRGSLPSNSTDVTIEATSTIDLNFSTKFENVTITARNMRYAIHADAKNAVASRDAVVRGVNSTLIHYGNDEVRTWRDANPGSGMLAATVWANERPWGYGSSSGWDLLFEGCTLIGNDAYTVHDFNDFTRPTIDRRIGCRLIGTKATAQISLSNLGAGQPSVVLLQDCEIVAQSVRLSDSSFRSEDPAKFRGYDNDMRLIVTGGSHGPLGCDTSWTGRVLRIESAATAAPSTVDVSGTAADVLFTSEVFTRDGGYGLKGYVYGWPDISGRLTGGFGDVTVNNTLGRLLGDCSVTSKTLTVAVNGGAGVNVVFSTDQTARTNSAILTDINAALGATATATEYDPAKGEWFPELHNDTRTLVNNGATGIGRFHAVKKSGTGVALFTTTDPASAFYGVAVDPILPGKAGRILTRGRIKSSATYQQIPGVASAVTAGQYLYHSPTTGGQFTTTANTRPAMAATIADWADFGAGVIPDRRYAAVKTADTIRNNDATATDDPHLTIANVVPGYYHARFLIHATGTAAADFKYGVTLPGASTAAWHSDAQATAATTVTGARNQQTFSAANTPTAGLPTTPTKMTWDIGATVYIDSVGTVAFKWAQGTAEVSDLTVHSLSSFTLNPLAL